MSLSRVPGLDALGAGYNVFGAYESAKSITHSLLDWGDSETFTPDNQRHYSIPTVVEGRRAGPADLYTESGWTFREYCEQLNTKTRLSGSFAFFSASLEVEFSQDVAESYEYAYTTVFDRNPHFHLKLRPYLPLPDMVKRPIRQALDQMQPSQLFDTYGTHFVASLVVGTKALASYSTLKSRFTQKEKLSISAEMSYKTFARASVEHTTQTASTLRQFNDASTSHIRVYGGRQEQGTHCQTYEQWKAWADTAHQDPVFIEFLDAGSLKPIWELCTNESRKSFLREAYKAYAAAKTEAAGWTEDKPGPRITDVRVICGDNKDIPADFGYTKIPVDLNQGAGGDFIYLTFKKESSGTPVTDLQVVYAGESSGIQAPRGYELINVDLNKGAGGEYIYLCKTYAPGLPPITDLKVIASDSRSQRAPAGYERLDVDLNKGAGGKFIYLYAKR
jgi:hypothetical protein